MADQEQAAAPTPAPVNKVPLDLDQLIDDYTAEMNRWNGKVQFLMVCKQNGITMYQPLPETPPPPAPGAPQTPPASTPAPEPPPPFE